MGLSPASSYQLFKYGGPETGPKSKPYPLNKTVMPEPGGGADQLTLFQLGEDRLSPLITTAPPKKNHLPASLQEDVLWT